MQITHITYQSSSGGALYVSTLTKSLAKNNINVNLICPQNFEYKKNLYNNRIKIYLIKKSKIYFPINFFNILINQINCFKSSINFCKKLKNENSIIHLNHVGEFYFLNLILIKILKIMKFKVVYTIHDIIPHRWLFPMYLRFFEKTFLRLLYQRCDALIIHYKDGIDMLEKQFSIERNQIYYIPHFGSAEYLKNSKSEKKYQNKNNYLTALMFGGIRETKGVHLAIKAIQSLNKNKNIMKLIIAGRPSSKERPYWEVCKNLYEKNKFNIEIIEDYIADSEILSLVERCDFFLLPYSNFFSQSGVASIAVSNAKPIVGTNVGGLSDFVQDKNIGISIKGPIPSTLNVETSLLKAFQLGPKKLKYMGLEVQKFCKKKYSLKKNIHRYKKLYKTFE